MADYPSVHEYRVNLFRDPEISGWMAEVVCYHPKSEIGPVMGMGDTQLEAVMQLAQQMSMLLDLTYIRDSAEKKSD